MVNQDNIIYDIEKDIEEEIAEEDNGALLN